MTPTPTPQQILELAREAGIFVTTHQSEMLIRFATLLLERYGQAPAVQQEPVAWMYDWLAHGHDKPVCDWISQDKDEVFDQRNGYFNIRALYTHPAPAAVREILEPLPPVSGLTEVERKMFRLGWTEAEIAHGIGSKA